MKGKRRKPTPNELAEIGWMRTGGLRDLGYTGTPQFGLTERWFDEDTGDIIEREVEDIDACLLQVRPAGTPKRKCIPLKTEPVVSQTTVEVQSHSPST